MSVCVIWRGDLLPLCVGLEGYELSIFIVSIVLFCFFVAISDHFCTFFSC